MRKFNEIFMKNVSYDDIKSHKKQKSLSLCLSLSFFRYLQMLTFEID